MTQKLSRGLSLCHLNQFCGPGDGGVDMGTEVLRSHGCHKAALFHGVHGLLVYMGQDQGNAAFRASFVELLQGMHGGGVQCRHAAHPEDDDLRVLAEADGGDALGGAEEHGAGDLIDTDMGGKGL